MFKLLKRFTAVTLILSVFMQFSVLSVFAENLENSKKYASGVITPNVTTPITNINENRIYWLDTFIDSYILTVYILDMSTYKEEMSADVYSDYMALINEAELLGLDIISNPEKYNSQTGIDNIKNTVAGYREKLIKIGTQCDYPVETISLISEYTPVLCEYIENSAFISKIIMDGVAIDSVYPSTDYTDTSLEFLKKYLNEDGTINNAKVKENYKEYMADSFNIFKELNKTLDTTFSNLGYTDKNVKDFSEEIFTLSPENFVTAMNGLNEVFDFFKSKYDLSSEESKAELANSFENIRLFFRNIKENESQYMDVILKSLSNNDMMSILKIYEPITGDIKTIVKFFFGEEFANNFFNMFEESLTLYQTTIIQ